MPNFTKKKEVLTITRKKDRLKYAPLASYAASYFKKKLNCQPATISVENSKDRIKKIWVAVKQADRQASQILDTRSG